MAVLFRPGTFSISTARGRRAATTRRTSGHSHRSSPTPFRFPATLTGWQGNPPKMRSTGASAAGSRARTSPWSSASGNRSRSTRRG